MKRYKNRKIFFCLILLFTYIIKIWYNSHKEKEKKESENG